MVRSDARVKATTLVTIRKFVEMNLGAAGWDSVLHGFAHDEREKLNTLIASEWVSADLHVRVVDSMVRVMGGSSTQLIHRFGRFAAEHDLNTVFKVFLRMLGPKFTVNQLMTLWPRYYNTGRWTIDHPPNTRSCVATLEDWGVANENACLTIAGFLARLIELASGSDHAVVTHPECRARGASVCVFHGRW